MRNAVLLLLLASTSAYVQDIPDPIKKGKGIKKDLQSGLDRTGNPFWQHPRGDVLVPQHPNGDPVKVPCTHLVKQHPDGHPLPNAPCTHMKAEHPDGDDTGKKGPCVHPGNFGPKHPDGDPIMVPCTHLKAEHPEGHAVPPAPCAHMTPQHPDGDDTGRTGPCVHNTARAPKNSGEQTVPCTHPVPLVRSVDELGLKFYFDDKKLQQDVIDIVKELKKHDVDIGISLIGTEKKAKPLNVFNHPAVWGNPDDNTDPMWSHYNPTFHSIQITKGGKHNPRETFAHELGHALVGHCCVQIMTQASPHSIDKESDPGTAMSEGWAQFVGLVCLFKQNEAEPVMQNMKYETGDVNHPEVPYTVKSEFRVTCILWDIYDLHDDGEKESLPFDLMFKIYSPTLATLPNGPLIPDIDNYLDRLSNQVQGTKDRTRAIRDKNLTKPK